MCRATHLFVHIPGCTCICDVTCCSVYNKHGNIVTNIRTVHYMLQNQHCLSVFSWSWHAIAIAIDTAKAKSFVYILGMDI